MSDRARRLAARLSPGVRERIAAAPPWRFVAVAALALLLLVALFTGGDEEPLPEPPPPAAPAETDAESGRSPRGVADLSLEDKVAQLFLAGFEGTDRRAKVFSDLRRTNLGGLVLTSENYESAAQLEELTGDAASAARRADHVAPWTMAAQEGGEFSAFADLPPEDAPADVRTPEDAAKLARETGRALKRAGVNGVLAPVVDVAPESGGAIGRRAFSDSTALVVPYAEQTTAAYEDTDVFAAAKHFPGLGAASQPTEVGPANVGLSLAELEQRDLRPFEAAIAAGVPGVLVGHGLYVTDDFLTPASLSSGVIEGLLRDRLGFQGVTITDDLAASGVTFATAVPDAAVEALRVGADMVYISDERGREAAYEAVLAAARDGELPALRIDEAVTRVLDAKREYGLID